MYAAGRLDRDSEGLLVLTNNGALQARLTQPGKRTGKIYYVQVEGIPTQDALEALRNGVTLNDGLPCPQARSWLKNPRGYGRGIHQFVSAKYSHQLAEDHLI